MRVHVHLTLADPYTAEEVIEDVYTLLAEWDLSDDLIYPWREDNFTTIAPFVTRNQNPAPQWPLERAALIPGWTDPDAYDPDTNPDGVDGHCYRCADNGRYPEALDTAAGFPSTFNAPTAVHVPA